MTDVEMLIKDVGIALLKDTKAGAYLEKAMATLQKVQEVAYAAVTDDSPEQLKAMRVGTALAFSIIGEIATGRSIKDFTESDWKNIATKVIDSAVLTDGQQWSVIVFTLYADYIDSSAGILEKRGISGEKCGAIHELADQVRDFGKELLDGNITEVDYTEKCLWILLEAMIKLLSAYSMIYVGEDVGEFIQSISMLAFEYGRYTLYKQEQEILEMYLQHQYEVDDELQERLDVFNLALKDKQEEFNSIISNAFVPDSFRRFRTSIELARNVGVEESEILVTTKQIDDFFM